MVERKYEKIFPDIAEEHPRMELETLGKIVVKVYEEESNNREVTQTLLTQQTNIKRGKIVRRVGILEGKRYLELLGRVSGAGGVLYLDVEGERPIWDWHEQNEEIERHIDELKDRIDEDERVSEVVDQELIEKFLDLVEREELRNALLVHKKILEILEESDIKEELRYAEIKSKALRLKLRPKGIIAAEKVKEESKSEEDAESDTANEEEGQESAEATA